MGATLRALRALVLLCGFHLLSLVLLAIPVVRGMSMLRAPRGEGPPGLPVTEADEPRLWALVRELAAATGTRAPDAVVLTGDVDAAVSEEPRLPGLHPGPRRLYLGVPLLTGLTEAGLKAVLAHEYGHFTGGDTRLSALAVRGRVQIGRTVGHCHGRADGEEAAERARQEKAAAERIAKGRRVEEIDTVGAGIMYRLTAAVYTAYARLCMRATLPMARAQEYAADLAAARIAGRDATATALREIPVLSAAHDFYLGSYATLGLPARQLPPRGQFFGGFGRMLTARETELAGLREELPSEPGSPYDSHPPIADRVRRIEALPADGRGSEDGGPALALLADPARTLAALEDAVLSDEVGQFERAGEWGQLLSSSMAVGLASLDTPLHRALACYTEGLPTLPALLAVIDEGRLWQLARRLPPPDLATAGRDREFREAVRPVLRDALQSMVLAEFSARSLLHWEFSWSRPAAVRLPGSASDLDGESGTEAALHAAVTAALADRPDTGPLRALLPPTPQSA
ncbi:M48 family metallopeptidase [Streptomyces hyaluromycini]|uniref:M48 family metallopeptidase n=1 Tax=Streptomyces hyaluromycini TaxID=1377993 RepID=UPI000B5C3A33|nr:M48 family metallopeptidase [Streptomyces hyaluromycini]